jgi:hypothetical protein
VLVERELLGRVIRRLWQASANEREQLRDPPPAFIANPSWEYLDAVRWRA